MKRNLTIGITMLLIAIFSISCIALGSSFLSNDKEEEKERDVLLSFEEYEEEYGKDDIVLHLSEGELPPEAFFGEGSLIVRGKLKSIKGVAFTVGEAPCIVYELEVTDTTVNSTGKEHKVINLAIPEMMIPYVEDKLQMDQESVFYLDYYETTFPHLKEDYYGLISPTRGIENFSGDKEGYNQLKKDLIERKEDFDNKKNR